MILVFYAIALLITIVGTVLRVWRRGDRSAAGILGSLLGFFLFSFVGLVGLGLFYGHVFRADATAEYVGWPAGNPFQFEVSLISLGTGVAGILCLWWRGGFRWATAIIFTIFYWGATYGHIYELVVNDNHSPGNSGPILYIDIILPLIILSLMAAFELSVRRGAERTFALGGREEAERRAA